MKTLTVIVFLLLVAMPVCAQHDADFLEVILKHYYKNEKIVLKGRTQFLFLYCGKANNNEQLYETVDKLKLPAATIAKIKKKITTDTDQQDWQTELEAVYAKDRTKLNHKINDCLTLEQYQAEIAKRNLNHQRLMVISKPILYDAKHALVKVVFYRTIEHNNGSVIHLEKINNQWVIKEFLDSWST